MTIDLTHYKRTRLLTGGIIPIVLAFALLAFARWSDPAWETGEQIAGICRELIAGTTEGRQALFGSCWVAPLPVLYYLPFAWLLPEPLAGWCAFLVAWLFVFWCVRETLKDVGGGNHPVTPPACHPSAGGELGYPNSPPVEGCPKGGVVSTFASSIAWRIIAVQIALAAWLILGNNPALLQVPAALTIGLMMLAAAGLAWWIERRKTRDIVSTAAATACLVLCGFPVFAPAILIVLLLPLAALGHPDTRKRFPAWLLLGGLPLVYTFSVWMLMNRLMLGDSLFFLRSLKYLMPTLMIAPPPYSHILSIMLIGPALMLLPVLILTWWLDSRATKPDRFNVDALPAGAALVSLAFAVMAYAKVFSMFEIGWPVMLLNASALAIFFLTLGRLGRAMWRFVPMLALLAYFGSAWIKPTTEAPPQNRAEICQSVEDYVNARTPYGRVFALGYAGMDLLRGYKGERLLPNLDLQLTSLRHNYKGQNIYVLVPNPVGVNRAESVFWRFPDIYLLGTDRLNLCGTFGTWHLFELIAAPTQEQLDEWKTPAP